MNNKISIVLIPLSIHLNLFGQVADDSFQDVVLKNNIIDSLHVFGEWNKIDGTETHLKYLGIIRSENGNFKIITSCWLWGSSKRATNRILVFNEDTTYLGNYHLAMKYDLPEKIENNQLVFFHSESDDCDKNIITRLSFDKGIPKQFFLECKNGYGDVYSFYKE
ncbi:hypothetical protein [uncultured Dokdonia sp.]|uniref:hypothetical protein n=1 Tax=uncultured Dokdonia sp. TaxID=575653 RepID=UPI0026126BDD|nr:hypothetical protein [uncultured Dokdonia sp.]